MVTQILGGGGGGGHQILVLPNYHMYKLEAIRVLELYVVRLYSNDNCTVFSEN